MADHDWLAERFEEHRTHLHAVAYRMLGSLGEAEDAVQEAWLRLGRTDAGAIENLGGWLTTAVARVCLDMLRSRSSRREAPLDAIPTEVVTSATDGGDPEQEALLADSVGLALLVVLETLSPPERLAFVLHDVFAVPFDEIAPIVERSPAAARQLASRARRRVHGAPAVPETELTRQRAVVDTFLAASRRGDFTALLAVLDPDVEFRADGVAALVGTARSVRGAEAVATQAVRRRARAARMMLVDGEVGAVIAPRGRLLMVFRFTVHDGKVVAIDAIADPEHLRRVDLAVLTD